MTAVVRLNLVVALLFLLALGVTTYFTLQQAARDIEREVTVAIDDTYELMAAAAGEPDLVATLLQRDIRHVDLEVIEDVEQLPFSLMMGRIPEPGDVPLWFYRLVPGLDRLASSQYVRYLEDGRALRVRADVSDELEEVWESFLSSVTLFVGAAVLSLLAITLGVRQGTRPIARFLWALDSIGKGHYQARLGDYSIRELNQLSAHFNRMAATLEAVEVDNRRLTRTLLEVQEAERAHLARELHDDLGQYLTGMQAQAYLISESPQLPAPVSRVANEIAANCEAMHKGFRRLIRDLHPVVLKQLGLTSALQDLAENWSRATGIQVVAELDAGLPELSEEASTHVYRILQEALNNVARHAGANRVTIRLEREGEGFSLAICDNGGGLQESQPGGLGIRSMRERARFVDGELTLSPGPDGGCCVTLSVPGAKTAR
ncbi:MAG: histidine kinase [Marinobacter sp.]|uniref:sensor histidine kinase n=1 Tax=Marinobacter sp. TaxID=50741 RepID=UPI00299D4A63|nr:histidine kinase [Marinobacter sp.]MDX1634574.1 histidine kinase [Marinobacter sp.]